MCFLRIFIIELLIHLSIGVKLNQNIEKLTIGTNFIDGPLLLDECFKKSIYDLTRCDLDACERFDCFIANQTIEISCKLSWDSFCSYTQVVARYCTQSDQKLFEDFLHEMQYDLETTYCEEWPRKSYSCNGSAVFRNNSLTFFTVLSILTLYIFK